MYLRYVDENAKAVTFEEVFYMATKGGDIKEKYVQGNKII